MVVVIGRRLPGRRPCEDGEPWLAVDLQQKALKRSEAQRHKDFSRLA